MTFTDHPSVRTALILIVFAVGALILSAEDCRTQLISRAVVDGCALATVLIAGPLCLVMICDGAIMLVCSLIACFLSRGDLGLGDAWCIAFFSLPVRWCSPDIVTASMCECWSICLSGMIGILFCGQLQPHHRSRASPFPFIPALALSHAGTLLFLLIRSSTG
jgi:hypothetical protein